MVVNFDYIDALLSSSCTDGSNAAFPKHNPLFEKDSQIKQASQDLSDFESDNKNSVLTLPHIILLLFHFIFILLSIIIEVLFMYS